MHTWGIRICERVYQIQPHHTDITLAHAVLSSCECLGMFGCVCACLYVYPLVPVCVCMCTFVCCVRGRVCMFLRVFNILNRAHRRHSSTETMKENAAKEWEEKSTEASQAAKALFVCALVCVSQTRSFRMVTTSLYIAHGLTGSVL